MINKVVALSQAQTIRQQAKAAGKKAVFTNGVFDILHRGHVEYLEKARELGDLLIIGLNSDASVRRIKGPQRPLCSQEDRAMVLSALACVDYIVLFDEDTPQKIVESLVPDILVKGADYSVEQIVGADVVLRNGGKVLPIELTPGKSTSGLIKRIVAAYGAGED
ncbi:D-glycero-beta-D-manno-heptose 1-phosphate adenylyltransferase [candidate division TA06 bacterium]|uniref:D-glycero-beta-D-manno-heptose 1-phosphate adenylyltransferase n=1 Tax=candidate division TA06 bacterium TaxID=2250710 RepID=A0A933I8P5_UNCT6|nr:D-glycero-beta-D-manno-heptose 1-phosphate adenylyltransferase [candidate division TA06 bacterium]